MHKRYIQTQSCTIQRSSAHADTYKVNILHRLYEHMYVYSCIGLYSYILDVLEINEHGDLSRSGFPTITCAITLARRLPTTPLNAFSFNYFKHICINYYFDLFCFLFFQTWFFTDTDDAYYQEKTSEQILCNMLYIIFTKSLCAYVVEFGRRLGRNVLSGLNCVRLIHT